MANDKPYIVRWDAGQIVVHRATPASAIEVALEYLRVPEAKRIRAEEIKTELEVVDGGTVDAGGTRSDETKGNRG